MNKLSVITLLATSLGLSHAAQAGDNGIYLGVGAGSVSSSVSAKTVQGLSKDFDGNTAAYKAILGVRPLDWLAAEVNYLDFGKTDSAAFAADSTGLSGSAVLFARMGPTFEVFAKGGVVNWKSKISEGSQVFKQKGNDPVYGGGLVVHVLSLSVRAEYEHFDMDADSNLVSVGLTWTFL